jgi:hypothetical protein
LRKDEAALEHGFQEDEDAEEVSIRAGEHDGRHSADDGEMNDDDAAEGYLAEFLNPGEWPIFPTVFISSARLFMRATEVLSTDDADFHRLIGTVKIWI